LNFKRITRVPIVDSIVMIIPYANDRGFFSDSGVVYIG
jgi:hypothetical protein